MRLDKQRRAEVPVGAASAALTERGRRRQPRARVKARPGPLEMAGRVAVVAVVADACRRGPGRQCILSRTFVLRPPQATPPGSASIAVILAHRVFPQRRLMDGIFS
ncbi:hypothetical protein EVAR_102278_1 [Eumeta japonica]|uniref:Uncharacterized protein n=1 Tax=Eumeta variegata TaxID=151549 RepID=A0A4C1WIZ2_EUMVA|nr:hypothetical protein EVAR_102278_1 [Eumeta japonica]